VNTSEALSPATIVVSNKRSAACDLDGEMVILQLDSGVYFGLNGVGTSIWNYIQEQRSIEDVISQMMVEYKVARTICEREILTLLQNMAAHGLVDVRAEVEKSSHVEAA
jgi:coenzyme PQQ synthesis protein D (PqqD)